MKIYLIAGHHNNDPGAVNMNEKEADLTKEFRSLLHDAIHEIDCNAHIELDNDAHTLSQVISEVNKTITDEDDLYDIHFNSFSNQTANGAEVLIKNGSPLQAKAATFSKIIAQTLGIKDRGPKTDNESARGQIAILNGKGKRYLFEIAFMSNDNDMKSYHSNKNQLAKALASEILSK